MFLLTQTPGAWFVMSGGVQYGPMPRDEVERLAREGRIGPNDLVFTQGAQNWFPAAQVPGLFSSPGQSSVARRKRGGGMGAVWAIVIGAVSFVLLGGAVYLIFSRTSQPETASHEIPMERVIPRPPSPPPSRTANAPPQRAAEPPQRDRELTQRLVGYWKAEGFNNDFELKADGTYLRTYVTGQWSVKDGQIIIRGLLGLTSRYDVSLSSDGNQLTYDDDVYTRRK